MLRVFPSLLPDPQRDEWTDSPQELSIPGISSKRPLSKAWERYNDLLYKCPTYDINNHQKINIFYKGLSTMNRQMLDSHGPITGMKPAQALTAIQTMVGCQICEGPRLDKDCPLNEEVKQVKEEALLAKHQEESARISTEMEEIYSDKTISSSSRQIKTITAYQETYVLNKLHGVSFMSETEGDTLEVLLHQLPPKELNPGSFTLPCTIASSQESNNHRPRDYTFREWTLIKVGHTDISEPVKKALLKLWLIDYFQDDSAIINNPTHRSFDDHKWEFNLEIDKLADEYEIGIWEKGHILDNIWEYCNQVHNDNNGWHNHEFKNEEREEMGIEDEDYHPPEVQVETFKVKNTHLEVDKVLSMFPKT
ncbi:hypothetical protein Tco_1213913 [Tanacetum coccineum]